MNQSFVFLLLLLFFHSGSGTLLFILFFEKRIVVGHKNLCAQSFWTGNPLSRTCYMLVMKPNFYLVHVVTYNKHPRFFNSPVTLRKSIASKNKECFLSRLNCNWGPAIDFFVDILKFYIFEFAMDTNTWIMFNSRALTCFSIPSSPPYFTWRKNLLCLFAKRF